MTPEQISYFRTFGFFFSKQLLSGAQIESLATAFDCAMETAGGVSAPGPGEKRQQVIPFFDYDPEAFTPSSMTSAYCNLSRNSSVMISSSPSARALFTPAVHPGTTTPTPLRVSSP